MELRSRNLTPLTTATNGSDGSELGNIVKCAAAVGMKRRKLLSFYYLARILTWGFFGVYVVIPLLVHFSTTIQTNIIFLSFVKWPVYVDFTNPDANGLGNTYNFYVKSSDGITLGVWHALPSSVKSPSAFESNEEKRQFFENSLKNGLPVVLYAHGNSGTRAGSHRVLIYKVFRDLNYHVITFDYRSYADSSNVSPTEDGVVSDAKFMYQWLRARIPAESILIWGHSLGTGVSTKMVRDLCEQGDQPLGLVLESPFNNLRDEVRNHPLTVFYRFLPFFDTLILDGIEKSLVFASDKAIKRVTVPILILHAEDDKVIPIKLGKRLYEAAIDRDKNVPYVKLHTFEGHHGYGHKYICRAPELPGLITNFVEKCNEHLALS
uniref:AB hydrolase-1 domain-containing protein n=1 Tax=Strigamia maritima TaxID=126957 RepID=T1IIE7_STRMM